MPQPRTSNFEWYTSKQDFSTVHTVQRRSGLQRSKYISSNFLHAGPIQIKLRELGIIHSLFSRASCVSTAGQGATFKLIKNRCVESTKAKLIKNWAMTNTFKSGRNLWVYRLYLYLQQGLGMDLTDFDKKERKQCDNQRFSTVSHLCTYLTSLHNNMQAQRVEKDRRRQVRHRYIGYSASRKTLPEDKIHDISTALA